MAWCKQIKRKLVVSFTQVLRKFVASLENKKCQQTRSLASTGNNLPLCINHICTNNL